MRFQVGAKVIYKRKRVKGVVTHAYYDGVVNRYIVQCRLETWSVPEGSLEMHNSSPNSPINSDTENRQNDDLPRP